MTASKLEGLTRGQAFAFAAYLALTLREDRRRREAAGIEFSAFESGADEAVYAETLDFLLGTSVEEFVEWPETRAYYALLDGVSPEVTSRLLSRLRAGAAGGGGRCPSTRKGGAANARILLKLEEIVAGPVGRTDAFEG